MRPGREARRAAGAVLCTSVLALAACGATSGAPSPSAATSSAAPNGPSATPQLAGSTRTVLSQLGLNMHSDASRSASVVGVLGQGAQVTVLDYKPSDGGWFKVQGQTVTGWIVADPTLTAAGALTSYSSSDRGFSALYPSSWTFAEEPGDTLFRPQQTGQQTIVVRVAVSVAALGQPVPPGYASTYSNQEIVCGYTGQLVEYGLSSGASAPASPNVAGSSAKWLSHYAQIRLSFDSMHAMELAINYESQSDLQTFADFYNSISFPYPLCQAPQSPAPVPT